MLPPPRARRPAGARRSPTRSCAERFLQTRPEAGAALGRLALDLRELAEERLLLRRKALRRPDVHADQQIAVPRLAQSAESLAADAHDGAGLSSGRHTELLVAVRR